MYIVFSGFIVSMMAVNLVGHSYVSSVGHLDVENAYEVSYSAESTLCSLDEVVIASCHISAKNKIVSFCSSSDREKISYRFGVVSKIELEAVFSNNIPLSRWVDVATYTVYLGFKRREYNYVFGVPQETLGAKAFLDVTKGSESIMSAVCTDNSFGEKNLINTAIRDMEDESVRSNGFLFPPDDEPSLDKVAD
jgi:hypothetical protein